MRLKSLLKNNLIISSIIITGGGLLFFIILWYLYPHLVYDQFIWKYFWGPILSDGLDKKMIYNGVSAAPKFTLVSEIVYGLIVAVVLYGLYRLLKKWNISVDFSFFLGVLPFIIYGSVARVLEDAHLFTEPLVFCFVTPLIYIQTLFFTILAFLLGIYLCKIKKITRFSIQHIIGICGIILLLPTLYYVFLWMSGATWGEYSELYPIVFLFVGIISIIITVSVFIFSKITQSYWKQTSVYSLPINLFMIFGHQLDGIASYISIYDPLKMGLPLYVEKHPASDLLMQIWPPLFPIVKFLLIIGIIYMLDIVYRDELKSQKRFVYLLKIGIFILGFAPGLRDLLRVAMGV